MKIAPEINQMLSYICIIFILIMEDFSGVKLPPEAYAFKILAYQIRKQLSKLI